MRLFQPFLFLSLACLSSAHLGAQETALKSIPFDQLGAEAQKQYLMGLHCASFQGYLCSPALPAADFEVLVRSLSAALV